MTQEGRRVLKEVHEAWNAAVDSMKRMYSGILVRPVEPHEVFTPVKECIRENVVNIGVAPIVFNVPERADARKPNLYIVVTGWLNFLVKRDNNQTIRTKDFGTKVAYFRSKGGYLEHIYGAHYDMDERRVGHPVFHSQIGSQMEIGENIKQQFRDENERIDCIGKLFEGIRTPTAQMDFFSVFTQICADHLLGLNSTKEVKLEFDQTRKICSFFTGAAHRMEFLHAKRVFKCYRSTHWYRLHCTLDRDT